jgi:hypothetical protein
MSGCSSLCVTFGRYDHGHRDICMYLYRHPFTQFYFRTTQKCKRYLNLAFKYLVLFRRRNVSLVPFGAILTLPPPPWDFATAISAEEGKSGSSRASERHQKLRLLLITRKNHQNLPTTSQDPSCSLTSLSHLDHRLLIEALSAKAQANKAAGAQPYTSTIEASSPGTDTPSATRTAQATSP